MEPSCQPKKGVGAVRTKTPTALERHQGKIRACAVEESSGRRILRTSASKESDGFICRFSEFGICSEFSRGRVERAKINGLFINCVHASFRLPIMFTVSSNEYFFLVRYSSYNMNDESLHVLIFLSWMQSGEEISSLWPQLSGRKFPSFLSENINHDSKITAGR